MTPLALGFDPKGLDHYFVTLEHGDRVHKMGLVVFFIIFYFLLLQ